MNQKIIIIGAGAAGLMCAYFLLKKNSNLPVLIIEGNNRIGGKIFTTKPDYFSQEIEAGAEFVHGKLPLTLALLKKGKIKYAPVKGRMVRMENGKKIDVGNERNSAWDEMESRMNQLKVDMTFKKFLMKYFNEEKFAGLRESAIHFAEGFDLADISLVSTFALRKEWLAEDSVQYRLEKGYSELIDFLKKKIEACGAKIILNNKVKKIVWKKNFATVETTENVKFTGTKCVITVPLNLLCDDEKKSFIQFEPAIPHHIEAAKKIHYGDVFKVMVEFEKPFWKGKEKQPGFILSDEIFPTWWTQTPSKKNFLTGWLGGPKALALKNETEEKIISLALQSLANIFQTPLKKITKLAKAVYYHNWMLESFATNAYSYAGLDDKKVLKILRKPVDKTIYFAGEAIYKGKSPGTVEAALQSGKDAAKKLVQ